MKKLTILILTVFFCHLNGWAGILCGSVVNDIDNKPVSGVIIWLENTDFADTTDINGNFLIENIPGGNYTIIMEHPDFMQMVVPDFTIDESAVSDCVVDCNGILGGSAYIDGCQTCVAGNTGLEPCTQDCNGDWGGTAYLDSCQTCVGGNTGLEPCTQDCNGDWGGITYLDSCQTCVGGNTGLEPCIQDCNGDWGGIAYLDSCQTCVGGNTGLEPCIVSGISDEIKNKLVLFFNQSEQNLYIRNTPPGIAVVYDLLGRPIVTKEINQEYEKINIPLHNSGIYLFVLKSNDGIIYTHKISL